MARTCPLCSKDFQSSRGIMRHTKYCPRQKPTPRWRDYHKPDNDASDIIEVPKECSGLVHTNSVGEDVEEMAHDRDWTTTLEDDGGPVCDDTSKSFSGISASDFRQRRMQVSSSRMTVSSAAVTVIDTYLEVEGGRLAPGHAFKVVETMRINSEEPAPLQNSLPTLPLDQLTSDWFYPFRNLAEYELSSWLFSNKTTAAKMKEFFELHLGPWNKLTSVKSVRSWQQALHRIPYGIPDDQVLERCISVQVPETGQQLEYMVRYRSILGIIRFLIGFIPFKPNLAYAPVRLFKDDEKSVPIFNEMHTGSWWWEQQKSLPPGGTVVPVLLASDKTLLTQHHGDKSSHPVYVTIGNLDKSTRRSQTRPSKILLGFLPDPNRDHHRLVHVKAYEFKRHLFNTAMRVMTAELQRVESEGIFLRCADGVVRSCFPIIGGFALDYEEQALITGVKSGQHCVICRIPPLQREQLVPLERFPLRTHEYTQERIRQIRGQKRKRDESLSSQRPTKDMSTYSVGDIDDKMMNVDDITSFMWSFRRVNMHEIMHVDILHQCFKGIVHRTITDWVWREMVGTYGELQMQTLIDQRFRQIPAFPRLKTFASFSSISQWTGVEQKAMLRQLVPALAPLVSRTAIQFVRALVDFTLHAQYYSHDRDTLLWMESAITRMDVFKEVFRDFTAAGVGFNIPKLHAITHYPMMIRKFGSADGYDTSMFEAGHKYIVKQWYQLTNKRETFEEQIFEHNRRAVKMMAMQDLLAFRVQENLVPNTQDISAQVTAAVRAKDLNALGWSLSGMEEKEALKKWIRNVPSRVNSPHLRRGIRYWRQASTVDKFTYLPGFLDALAAFVREERQRQSGLSSSNIAINRKETDSSWIERYPVCVHPSLACWKADRDDGSNIDTQVREFVRCDPQWQGRQEWRRDCVWVQEYPDSEGHQRPLQGRLPSQLLIIISIIDVEQNIGQENVEPSIYTGAFVDVYSLREQGKQNPRHGMIEAQRHPESINNNHRSLGHRRFYHLGLILRSVHLVPASDEQGTIFYINSYVDWDSYATVFDPDFLEKDAGVMRQIRRQHGLIPKRGTQG